MLYNFIRKPTAVMLYKGRTLKPLLDQRWTGHLATVKVVVKSFDDISTFLTKVENTQCFGAEVRVEAMELHRRLNPEAEDYFLDPSKITPLLRLAGTEVVETEYTVACEFLVTKMTDTLFPPKDGQ